jgi:amidase/6-aminohexanoate-cyclic-dimer hydrolase
VFALSDYLRRDGIGLAALVDKGEVTPEELLECALSRTAQLNPKLGAVVIHHAEYARQQIRDGLPFGPFRGVPFLLKNLHSHLRGTELTNGSRFFQGMVSTYNSTLVERYLAAGVVIFGKTNTPELGLSGASDPILYGPTRNPWDPTRSAGGSSGGAAAAVAAGMVPVAHGSDGGGSIRMPASVCGVVGLKPTRARVPAGPWRGEGWAGLSANHVMTRSVRDSAAMLDACAGTEPGDPYQVIPPSRPFLAEVDHAPRPLRVAWNTHKLDGTQSHPDVVAAIESTAQLLDTLGHHLEEAAPQVSLAEVGQHFGTLMACNLEVTLREREAVLGRPVTQEDVERLTWTLFETGQRRTGADYVRATIFAQRLGREMAKFHEQYNIYLSPTCSLPPAPVGFVDMNGDVDRHTRALYELVPSIAVFNMTGQPSMSIPLEWTAEGLPIGVMLSAPFGDEATLFRLAGQLERARPWSDRYPGLGAFKGE